MFDALVDVTLRIAKIKAGQMMDLIYDVPQEYICPETEDLAQLNPTDDPVPPLEEAFSPTMRICRSDEIQSQDGLDSRHGRP